MDCTDLTKTQQALTLWVAGTITLQMVLDAKSTRCTKSVKGSHNLTLPKSFLHYNSTEESTSFSDITWSRATGKYMDFITTGLCKSSFDKIIGKAKEMMASTHQLRMDNALDIDNFDEVQLVDLR